MALDSCYKRFCERYFSLNKKRGLKNERNFFLITFEKYVDICVTKLPYHCPSQRFEILEGRPFSMSDAEYFVFHSPYNKVCMFELLLSC